MHPPVDIICLVHNQLAVTRGFVKRLFQHTENFRLIFIDNGSTDKTPGYLAEGEKTGKWKVVTLPYNFGVIKGRNIGVCFVESDYFLNIDNDQYPRGPWLSSLFKVMDTGYDIVGCEAWCLHPPAKGGSVVMGNKSYDRSYYPFHRCTRPKEKFTYIGCGGMLIKSEIYDQIGLFDEQFSPAYYEDPDFCFRAIQAGFKLGWNHNCPMEHLAHQTIARQKLFRKNEQFLRSWRKFQKKWKNYFPTPLSMSDS